MILYVQARRNLHYIKNVLKWYIIGECVSAQNKIFLHNIKLRSFVKIATLIVRHCIVTKFIICSPYWTHFFFFFQICCVDKIL